MTIAGVGRRAIWKHRSFLQVVVGCHLVLEETLAWRIDGVFSWHWGFAFCKYFVCE
jgi:hypothetical protein